jgi:uncharacterized protein YcfJ
MKQILNTLGILTLVAVVAGCATPLSSREKGALAGGALGAGAGAIIGNQVDHKGRGALIGGAMGALGGAIVGDQMDGQRYRQDAQAYELEQQRREIERQRQELEGVRRNRYDSPYDRDPYYDPNRNSQPRYDDPYSNQRGAY